jgi:ribose-phosphate pyrophosphokinase
MIFLNKEPVETHKFSGGECHVKLPVPYHKEEAHIDACLYNSDDIMSLMMTVDALRQINGMMKINVTIPYFPYARQDRVCEPGEAFSLKVMADLINSLKVDSVVVIDPHSKMTPSLLDNCMVYDQHACVTTHMWHMLRNTDTTLVAPDEGAKEKTLNLACDLGVDYITCTKVRDTKTGDITKTYVPQGNPTRNYMIIDDICDGGRTFINIANILMEDGVPRKNLSLYVTHGIFSNGFAELVSRFEKLYCYHLFPNVDTHTLPFGYLTVFKGEKSYVH